VEVPFFVTQNRNFYENVGSVRFIEKEDVMPPCGFNRNSVRGALAFVRGCYEDLLDDVRSGKFKTYEEAIEHELKQIETVLAKLHIDAEGNLVER